MRKMLSALIVAVALPGAASSQLSFQGAEFQVNTTTLNNQYGSGVAGSASGFVVVWFGKGASDDRGVFGQRFSSAGTRLGGEFQVNAYVTQVQEYSSIAMDETGFVVVWTSFLQDGDGLGVFARRYDSSGASIASEFQVNIMTTGDQSHPSVAMSGGSFVVVWQSLGDYDQGGIFHQRFSSTGEPVGEQIFVNSYITGPQTRPSVAMDAQGFVVVWQSNHDGDEGSIFGRRFDSFGVSSVEEFQVNNVTLGAQRYPAVVKDSSGFVVVWQGVDGYLSGVFGRRYDSAGIAQASEFQVNSDISASEGYPAVAMRDGSFVAAWHKLFAPTPDIDARAFDSQGASPLGDLQVNAYTAGYQLRPAVARSGSGFVVVWDDKTQDSGTYGIFARRLLVSADLDIDGNGAVQPLNDGLLALRYAFGFRGATLINGAVAGDCTRCDAPAIEAYLAGLN